MVATGRIHNLAKMPIKAVKLLLYEGRRWTALITYTASEVGLFVLTSCLWIINQNT